MRIVTLQPKNKIKFALEGLSRRAMFCVASHYSEEQIASVMQVFDTAIKLKRKLQNEIIESNEKTFDKDDESIPMETTEK